MGLHGDDPPVAGRASPVGSTDGPAKLRRRNRRGKRSRWPYAANRDGKSGSAGPKTAAAHPADNSVERASGPIARDLFAKAADTRGSLARKEIVSSTEELVGDTAYPSNVVAPGTVTSRARPSESDAIDLGKVAMELVAPGAVDEGDFSPEVVPGQLIPVSVLVDASRLPATEQYTGSGPASAETHAGKSLAVKSILSRRRAAMLYAALDLGTNNCRLLIAEPLRTSFRVVDAFSRIVRLGEGMTATGQLSEAAQLRAIEALRICQAKLVLHSVDRIHLVATEACRAARNGQEFLDRVRMETGLDLEIVTRESEARLAVAGCASLIDWRSDGVVLFDIGGGSSELVWLDLQAKRRDSKSGIAEVGGLDLDRHIRSWTSLPIGVVTLAERHGGEHVDRTLFEAMVRDVDGLLDGLEEGVQLSRAIAAGDFHLLGTSGTVTTLAGVHLGLKRYDRRRVDGVWLAAAQVTGIIDRLLDMTYAERVANPCIGAERADLVLAGCAILEAIRRRWPCDRLRVADRGLREGILTEMMAADGVWTR